MMIPSLCLLGFVTAERLFDLHLAHRNTARLLGRGATEASPGHYPFIVALQAAWLIRLWALAWNRPLSWIWLVVFVILQAGRLWVLLTLKERWTTRIIVLPETPLIGSGPYRFVDHPTYLVVAGEIAVLPLIFGMTWFAALFSVLNAVVLTIRIRAENAALPKDEAP